MGYETSKNRRNFLRNMACTIAAGGAGALLPQMNLLSAALASTSYAKGGVEGYRALVCFYFGGGSDSYNMLMPREPGAFSTYAASRGGIYAAGSNPAGLAIDSNVMLPINALAGGSSVVSTGPYGLHPECYDRNVPAGNFTPSATTPGMQTLFGQNRVAFLGNVGTMVAPLNKTQYNNNSVPKPPQLFSHNDQTEQWHLGRTDPNWPQGWGGMVAAQVSQIGNGPSALSPCISIAGNNRFQIGKSVAAATLNQPISPYQMSTGGATLLNNFSSANNAGPQRQNALLDMLDATTPDPFSNETKAVTRRGRDLAIQLNALLLTESGRINTPYQNANSTTHNPATNNYQAARVSVPGIADQSNGVLDQLRMVARMIKITRDPVTGILADKQIYFVNLGGFDTHDNQMQLTVQPLLMARISQALGWFWQAMNEIGAQNEVTTFSMSEFGRTLGSNGSGSDHAWGATQFVMGGAVNGGKIYGRYPGLALNADNNATQDWSFARGQYIPTVAAEQMAATMATWMGVDAGGLATVFPNLANFSTSNLGFIT